MSYFNNEDQHYFSRYANPRARLAPRRAAPATQHLACPLCGKADLKWRWVDRLVLSELDNSAHQCTTADDCGDLV